VLWRERHMENRQSVTIRTDMLLTRSQIRKIHDANYKLEVTVDDADVYPMEFIHGAVIDGVNHLYLLTEKGFERSKGNVSKDTLGARMHLYGLHMEDVLVSLAGKIIAEVNMVCRTVDLHPKINAIPEAFLKLLPEDYHILSEKKFARIGDVNKAVLVGDDTTFKNINLWKETI